MAVSFEYSLLPTSLKGARAALQAIFRVLWQRDSLLARPRRCAASLWLAGKDFLSSAVFELILCGHRPLVISQSLSASQRLAAHQSGRASAANSIFR